ncbi:DUF4124 domain-containing protein [Sedimenticola hydrogenitrophicus]|uniref:DUF4124 domain-containing protein n=1 Tax=Sedimenticola hydrogenitrophicus TaxID=2967975 RepID=UPI0023B0D15A|nr:DUF4124 domain-containing protein [Sedimenticola hydrogenitrophicus]
MKGPLMLGMIAALFASQAGAAYKCVVDGKTTFSQTRCAPEAEKMELKARQPSETDIQNAETRAEEIKDQITKNKVQRDTRKIKYRISELERDVSRYQRSMDAELEIIRLKKTQANNNLAGATYEQALATEMKAVIDNYSSKISDARDQIKELRGQLSGLTQ